MYIYTIIAQSVGAEDPWIIDAWDEWSVDNNPSGWQEKVVEAVEKHGGENIRIARVKVSDNFMEKAFEPHEEESKKVGYLDH